MSKSPWSSTALGMLMTLLTIPASACVECDNDGVVTVDEIVTAVGLALSGGTAGCAGIDINTDGRITVDEILSALNSALVGCDDCLLAACGNGIRECSEDCDDGGFCAGEDAGAACASNDDCGGTAGACVGGNNNLSACTFGDDSSCPNGQCVKCRPVGGDGCAQNCTNETRVAYPLKPGVVQPDGIAIIGSGASIYGTILTVALPFRGSLVLTVGRSRAGSTIPVVVKAVDVDVSPIPVQTITPQTIACACFRGAPAQTCGGTVLERDGSRSSNCTPDFEMQETCPVDRPCAAIHGPGNTASGFIDCVEEVEYGVEISQDCNDIPGEPPYDPVVTVAESSSEAPGAAAMIFSAAIGTVVGRCLGSAADYGPDQQFCTADDLPSTFGTPNPIRFTTGTTIGYLASSSECGFAGCPWPQSGEGARFTCNASGQIDSSRGANLTGVFTSCDQPTIADTVVVNNLESAQP